MSDSAKYTMLGFFRTPDDYEDDPNPMTKWRHEATRSMDLIFQARTLQNWSEAIESAMQSTIGKETTNILAVINEKGDELNAVDKWCTLSLRTGGDDVTRFVTLTDDDVEWVPIKRFFDDLITTARKVEREVDRDTKLSDLFPSAALMEGGKEQACRSWVLSVLNVDKDDPKASIVLSDLAEGRLSKGLGDLVECFEGMVGRKAKDPHKITDAEFQAYFASATANITVNREDELAAAEAALYIHPKTKTTKAVSPRMTIPTLVQETGKRVRILSAPRRSWAARRCPLCHLYLKLVRANGSERSEEDWVEGHNVVAYFIATRLWFFSSGHVT